MHVPAPAKLYLPVGHITSVATVEPAAHAYPAEQSPEHAAVVSAVDPGVAKLPAGHAAVHTAVGNPGVAPKYPLGQSLHTDDPAVLYCPAAHIDGVEFVEPLAQAYPAEHGPEHAAEFIPVVAL